MEEERELKDEGIGVYLLTWAGLVGLLVLNILAYRSFSGWITIAVAFAQAVLALSYFMRLKAEDALARLAVLVGLGFILVIVWLVYSDIGYR